MSGVTRILGIDPGSRITGYGIIDSDGAKTRYVASGCISVGNGAFPGRLNAIFSAIGELVVEFAPQDVAVEQVFMHRNADSALKLGQARAAAICGTFGGATVLYEYAAREIKQAVVGRGGADKEQVQHMVKAILALEDLPPTDEADALAAAICHAHSHRLKRTLSSGPARRRGAGWRKFAG
ncbi:MAG: crossover junction endodeoxyribonuclease RuvC [Gammaproteobacteria bacterium]|nr:crossover junction endodeoxyribonuclease RuvC [Gammaproteobacteria bacterium]NND37450.1 crossover junction endodeoxyribonuclease RuvC [Gammaproteobacteria bacterium]